MEVINKSLPKDIWCLILQVLDINDLIKMRQLNHKFLDLIDLYFGLRPTLGYTKPLYTINGLLAALKNRIMYSKPFAVNVYVQQLNKIDSYVFICHYQNIVYLAHHYCPLAFDTITKTRNRAAVEYISILIQKKGNCNMCKVPQIREGLSNPIQTINDVRAWLHGACSICAYDSSAIEKLID